MYYLSITIFQAVCCVNMIQEQISVYFKPVISLTDRGVNARTVPEGTDESIKLNSVFLFRTFTVLIKIHILAYHQ